MIMTIASCKYNARDDYKKITDDDNNSSIDNID